VVERDLAKVDVAGSTPVSRSNFQRRSPAAARLFACRNKARYPSGKGEVCKTFIRRFDSDPRLQTFNSLRLVSLPFTLDESIASRLLQNPYITLINRLALSRPG
jgi:hypothetical protein